MYKCELCGKTGSERQTPVVRQGDLRIGRYCYLCINDGVVSESLDPSMTVTLSIADYVQCLETPAEIRWEEPSLIDKLWPPGKRP